ncbi:MAG: hypothetical protein LBI34_03215 [Puniceicoccales bacterium]|jgi:hypothetical protein|nr:hypothetical protein [Puniceicoccales bacterium]
MATKNQNYIELPVQDEIGTPEAGFVALGFADGQFIGKNAAGDPIYFTPKTYAKTISVPFASEDWIGSGNNWILPLGESMDDETVVVRDSAGAVVQVGIGTNSNGLVTLYSLKPFAGTAFITGNVTAQ